MKFVKVILASLAVAASAASFAQGTPKPDIDMIATLKKMYPSTQFKSVVQSDIPGLFEVTMGKNIVYTDKSGRYFLFGRLFDMQTQTDVTLSKMRDAGIGDDGGRSESTKIDTASLPIKDAVKFVKGNGKKTLYVFSDPDCPYCRQLEKSLAALSDTTIYLFMFPLDGHVNARPVSVAVWCAKDRAKAWTDYMAAGKQPDLKQCDNPIDRNIELGRRLGVQGTPTLYSSDGRMLGGAAQTNVIEKFMEVIPTADAGMKAPTVLAKGARP